ncbi:MAG: YbbR-like domain-containing protein [Proteobacteria bacterium]|nr:YbbR-like domain-containing protein [Pseudomonadota bacterium]
MLSALGKNLPLKILSIVLAVLLWAVISKGRGGEITEISLGIPLEFHNFPKGIEIVGCNVDRIDVHFSGPGKAVSTLSREGLSLPMDLSGAAEGETTFEIFPSDIKAPPNVTVTRVSPSSINVVLEKVSLREAPVVLRLEGDPQDGFTLGEPMAIPSRVRIQGPDSSLSRVGHIETSPVNVQGATQTLKGEIDLISPGSPVRLVDRSQVRYEIPVFRKEEAGPTP